MIPTIRRKAAAALVSSGLVAGALVAQAAPAGAATVTVSAGQSIQAAINAAPAGSTIKVKAGRFTENVAITKDNIKLQGTPGKTILKPPANPSGACSFSPPFGGPPESEGICVIGTIDFSTFTAIRPVTGVQVSGFTVRNFPNQGIFVLGGQSTTVQNNVLIDNGGYGVFANSSTGTAILGNTASGSGEAGIYVGDSPNANASVSGNTSFDNGDGIFIRDASFGSVNSNNLHDNCVGLLFLDTAEPGGTSNWQGSGNTANHNDRACTGSEDAPPISGTGILVLGGHNITLTGNHADDNQPAGEVFLPPAGIAVFSAAPAGGAVEANVTVVGNHALENATDLFWDGAGSAVTFTNNVCATSVPGFLCPAG